MTDYDSLPEEKLLKLIRKKNNAFSVPSVAASEAAVLSAAAPLLRKKSKQRSFLLLNRFMIFCIVGLLGYLAYDIFFGLKRTTEKVFHPDLEVNAEAFVIEEKEVKPYNYYQEQVAQRDIFEWPEKKGVESSENFLTQNVRLVGIVLGDVPEAIVEDTQEGRTYFLHRGDFLRGAKVDVIEEGKVLFFYEGEEIELKQ